MIGIENKDTSFFTVESKDIALNGKDFNKNIIGISITETTAGMPSGTLSFYDPDHLYSRILRPGIELLVTWGYKDNNTTVDSLLSKKINIDEISGSLVRRGLKGIISSPQGSGSENGVIIYNCNFTSFGFRGNRETKLYTSGTKKDVVSSELNLLGVSPTKRLIDFSLGNDAVTNIKSIRKDETTFYFLQRLAKEWRALFLIGFSSNSEPVAIFIDPNKIKNSQYQNWLLNSSGISNVIGYKGVLNNVKSYNWTANDAESGVGDNVKIDIVDGQIIYRRYSAEQKKVITYRLDVEKIQAVYDKATDFETQIKLTKELLSKKDFESIKHFFIAEESTTAPNGYGYRINCEMIGNPLFSPPNQIIINNGFPDVLGSSDSIWFLSSVKHDINNTGYNMSIEVIDVFALSPVGMVIR